jgi:RNA polymerase sigma-70 factor (ECF subfamily)
MNNALFLNNYDSNTTELYRLASYFTKNKGEAEELLQESVLKMYSKFYQYRPDSNFKAWASTIIRNTFINQYRKGKRYSAVPVEDVSNVASLGYAVNDGESNLTYEEVSNELEKLPSKYKKVINFLIEGFSYKEMAAELDIPIGTVKSQIFIARKLLKTQLNQHNLLN